MRWIGKTGERLLSLFVDDFAYAGIILGWLALNWLLFAHVGLRGYWRALVLFSGLATILAASAWRRAAR